ncbi:RNase P/MRP, p29 subunit [Poronia punctata]|nr:RNase P/MRP, p29 subunit [Poronia punctata]
MPPKQKEPPSQSQSLTQTLLRRAHSPDSTSRIFSEKIQHRPLFLKPSSPPPPHSSTTSRSLRRKTREAKIKLKKPKPLSARERRSRNLYTIPRQSQRHALFVPLNRLWRGYIREILGNELYAGGQGAAAKLSAADFHGAEVEVSRSRCPSRVGVGGIVVKDSRFTFEIVTERDQVKVLPKEGTMFRVRVPVEDGEDGEGEGEKGGVFCFEILGDQFQYRASDRANKKFKNHFLKNV